MKELLSIQNNDLLERFNRAELELLASSAHRQFEVMRQKNQIPWIGLPYAEDVIREAEEIGREAGVEFDHYLVFGMGGSALGARFLFKALGWDDPIRNIEPEVIDHIEPGLLKSRLENLKPWNTVVHFISKSGNTIETIAQALIVRDWLVKNLGENEASDHIYVTTSEGPNLLHSLAVEWKAQLTAPLPKDLVGRFSILSSVGLIPAATARIDIRALCQGARDYDVNGRQLIESQGVLSHPALFSALFHEMERRDGKRIVVFMSYSEWLDQFGLWLSQLWAESLGKKGSGLTPLIARGVADQHSLLQLFLEGPDDKVYTFIAVDSSQEELKLPLIRESFLKETPVAALSGQPLSHLLRAEYRATVETLRSRKRPVMELSIPELSPYWIGQLIAHFEAMTTYAGILADVNPFDQPAVEECKILIRKYLLQRE